MTKYFVTRTRVRHNRFFSWKETRGEGFDDLDKAIEHADPDDYIYTMQAVQQVVKCRKAVDK